MIMKKLFVCMGLLLTSMLAYGQQLSKFKSPKENPFPMLQGVTTYNYRFDYSKMKIEKLDAKEYIIGYVYNNEDDEEIAFKKFTKRIENKFIVGVNKEIIKKCKLDNSEDLPFEVVIFFTTVDEDGGHKIIGEVRDKKNNQLLTEFKTGAGGGKMNSFENLFLEELEKSSEKFADMFKSKVLDIANAKKHKKK
jgi:hypothetical protein